MFQNYFKPLLLILIVSIVGDTFSQNCSDLFFSEYAEGSSNNKYIEIYNPTSSSITLTGNYTVKRYANGSSSGATINLTGTIAAYGTYIIANPSANATILAKADITSGNLSHNGDDALALFKGTDTLDIFGEIGFDPGSRWGSGTSSTSNNTLIRKATIQFGDTSNPSSFDPSMEWTGLGNEDTTDIDSHTSSCFVCTPTRDTVTNTICEGDSATNGIAYYTISGFHADTLVSSVTGCDSIRVLDLTVNAVDRDSIADTICQGASIVFGTQTLSISGTYSDTAQNAEGCDSITVLNLIVNVADIDTVSDTICQGASIIFGSLTLSTSGTYYDTAQNVGGCDSVIVMELLVEDYIRDTIADTTCNNSMYMFGGKTLLMSGTYSDTSQNTAGCDSITTLELIVNSVDRDTTVTTICSGDSIQLGSKFYSVAGFYSDTLQNTEGCDSIQVLDLSITTIPVTTINTSACDTFTTVGGQMTNISGTFIDTLTAISGCDSIVRTNVVINYTQYSSDSITACGSYTSPSGKVWITSGTRYDTVSTKNGCDSILTLIVTIKATSSITRNISSCFTYTVPETGNTYTTSGTYQDTGVNAFGCSFFITTNLTINLANAGTVSVSGITLTANQTGVTYKWADCDNNFSHLLGDTGKTFTPIRNGNYAVIVTTPQGCKDTSACTSIMSVDLEEFVIDENKISVFPNPATEYVVVDVLQQNVNEDVIIRLFDAVGKLIYSKQVSSENNRIEIDLEVLESGMYTVSVSNEFFNTTKKLTVVR